MLGCIKHCLRIFCVDLLLNCGKRLENMPYIPLFFWQNRRPDFISVFMEKLVNWDAVSARYEAAKTAAAQKQEELSKSVRSEPGELYLFSVTVSIA